ncbi:hypothetical protein [Aeromonas sobria]|nr:hypothetical protein [Aeromonas sobria]TNI82231.1 hypothetical protein CF119_17165 [Aeromonas sobria]
MNNIDISERSLFNKVPEVTITFWIIKMMSTTVGETAADYLIFNIKLGLTITSMLMGSILLATLVIQLRADKYTPWKYWLAVVLVSIFGTLVTDNLTDQMGVPLEVSTIIFTFILLATFWFWYTQEKTLSIRSIDTPKRELLYWSAILVTFALGTAAGDWVSEGMDIGYMRSTLLFGGLISIVYAVYLIARVNVVLTFWIIYVLTRPLGASIGDLLSQSEKHGGLGFGVTSTSLIFFVFISVLVMYQSSKVSKHITINHRGE